MADKRSQGFLIAFSGIDGAGKSTQIQLLMDYLCQQDWDVRYIWSRGGYTPTFEWLKALLRRASGRAISPSGDTRQRKRAFRKGWVRRLWLILALLDLIWLYGMKLRWLRARGKAIVCDRYLWDTLVDFRLNFPQENVPDWWLWRLLGWVTPKPNETFLLLVPVEESLRRSDIKGEPFRDTPEQLTLRLQEYQDLARRRCWHVLDGQASVSALQDRIRSLVVRAADISSLEQSSQQPEVGG